MSHDQPKWIFSVNSWLLYRHFVGHFNLLFNCLQLSLLSRAVENNKLFPKQTGVLWKNDLGFPRVPHSR